MNKEINNYTHLGTVNFFLHFLNFLKTRRVITINDAKDYYLNTLIDDVYLIEGPIILLDKVGLISIEDNNISISEAIDEADLGDNILYRFLKYLNTQKQYEGIFQSNNIIFSHGNYFIKRSAFQLNFSNVRNLLISLNFIQSTGLGNPYKVNEKYNLLLKKYTHDSHSDKLERYTNQYIRNMELGELGEQFVLEYERNRIGGSNSLRIEKVSDYDDSVGYDIASFESNLSKEFDRFIEVKSYNGKPGFFRSRNEVEISKQLGNAYYLYLVDRSLYYNIDYNPIIIINPYENIIKNNEVILVTETYQVIL